MALALGLAVLFNFIILRIKWNKKEYANVGVDLVMLLLLNFVFGGSILGVISATVGSTLISLYLIWFPFKTFRNGVPEEVKDAFTPNHEPKATRKSFTNMADRIDDLFK